MKKKAKKEMKASDIRFMYVKNGYFGVEDKYGQFYPTYKWGNIINK